MRPFCQQISVFFSNQTLGVNVSAGRDQELSQARNVCVVCDCNRGEPVVAVVVAVAVAVAVVVVVVVVVVGCWLLVACCLLLVACCLLLAVCRLLLVFSVVVDEMRDGLMKSWGFGEPGIVWVP